MEVRNKATSIDLFSLKTPQMRAFHMSWFAFFLCFFSWFGIAPVDGGGPRRVAADQDADRQHDHRVGRDHDRRPAVHRLACVTESGRSLSYTFLLIIGSIPVMAIGLATSYESFLLFRSGIGVIGASFVITQYHTSVMFAPNCVGTANATSAGWGNLGGGVTQMVMPLVFRGFVWLGFGDPDAVAACRWWRPARLLRDRHRVLLLHDRPARRKLQGAARRANWWRQKRKGSFWLAAKRLPRVGVVLHLRGLLWHRADDQQHRRHLLHGHFGLGPQDGRTGRGLFGLMNIFARTTGRLH